MCAGTFSVLISNNFSYWFSYSTAIKNCTRMSNEHEMSIKSCSSMSGD